MVKGCFDYHDSYRSGTITNHLFGNLKEGVRVSSLVVVIF